MATMHALEVPSVSLKETEPIETTDNTPAASARTPRSSQAYEPKQHYLLEAEQTPQSHEGGSTNVAMSSSLAGTNQIDAAAHITECVQSQKALYVLEPLDNIPPEADVPQHDIDLLHCAHHHDPFSVLGAHLYKSDSELNGIVVRFWRKDAREVALQPLSNQCFAIKAAGDKSSDSLSSKDQQDKNQTSLWTPMHPRCDWLFQVAFRVKSLSSQANDNDILAATKFYYSLSVKYHGDASDQAYILRDAYSFPLLLPAYDLQLFQTGSCWHVDNLMGSHIMEIEGARGVRFAVWAPNAQFVSVVGDFNQWDGRAHPMRKRIEFSVWELFIPGVAPGEKYGYRIHSRAGADFIKIDPYAQEFENPPATASVISTCDDAYKDVKDRYVWSDDAWLAQRKKLAEDNQMIRIPMSIYEVHLPSWMRGENNHYLGYREMAHRLVEHLKNLNFTHVEFLPLAHHPFEGSWGYQVSGFYAPYSRLGTPDDFKYLVNELHKNNIGVFLDFVPAHFVKDSWGIVYYDGEPCYEYADPREGEHQGWGTMVFNFRRSEVRSFLLGAAYHWLRRYHIDGLRIDAVSSMIYKNHSRKAGEWVPNEYGGDANLQAISLLQELNWVVHREFPGVFTMAEESTSWKGVTDQQKGLGFDAKWDLGWMNDTLSYLCTPVLSRYEQHQKLTFRGLYMAHEKWVLPLSHDEVVSGKGSLLDKCGFTGTSFDERIKTLRALFGFQIGMPGRPLIFMGSEFGQGREWSHHRSVDWHESREFERANTLRCVSDLLELYRSEQALHCGDDEIWNFQWVDCNNASDNIVAWLRKYQDWSNDILVICNFSGVKYHHYPIGVPHGGSWRTLFNSDDWKYGGTMHGTGAGISLHTNVGGSCLIYKAPQPATSPAPESGISPPPSAVEISTSPSPEQVSGHEGPPESALEKS